MKKLLCLVLAFVLAVAVLVSCGKKDAETTNAENDIVASEDVSEAPQEEEKQEEVKETTPSKEETKKQPSQKETPSEKVEKAPDENKVSDKNFTIILNGTKEESVLYHKNDCSFLEGRETKAITMEIVETLQFRCCSNCNPTKYAGYVE